MELGRGAFRAAQSSGALGVCLLRRAMVERGPRKAALRARRAAVTPRGRSRAAPSCCERGERPPSDVCRVRASSEENRGNRSSPRKGRDSGGALRRASGPCAAACSPRAGGGAVSNDAGPDASASVLGACFGVPPRNCGAIAPWSGVTSGNGWLVEQAAPIEGGEGFVALVVHGTLEQSDSFAFVTLDAGGCAKLAAPTWTQVTKFAGVRRAVERGGTFGLVGACIQRFSCGSTLFLNGREWIDPIGRAYMLDVDVASDGRVLLTERRYPNLTPYDVAILDDGTVAVAVSGGNGIYVQFQSVALDNVATWNPGANTGRARSRGSRSAPGLRRSDWQFRHIDGASRHDDSRFALDALARDDIAFTHGSCSGPLGQRGHDGVRIHSDARRTCCFTRRRQTLGRPRVRTIQMSHPTRSRLPRSGE